MAEGHRVGAISGEEAGSPELESEHSIATLPESQPSLSDYTPEILLQFEK